MPRYVIINVPPNLDLRSFVQRLEGFGRAYAARDEANRYVVEFDDDYVAFNPDPRVLEEYSDDELSFVRAELGGDFVPIVFEFRTTAGARRALMHVLPHVHAVIDDDFGRLETTEQFMARLEDKGDRWLE